MAENCQNCDNNSRRLTAAGGLFRWALPLAALLAAALPAIALLAPGEVTMGDAQRIVYIHVPVAWVGLLGLIVTAGAGVMQLLRRELGLGSLVAGRGRIGMARVQSHVGHRLALGPRSVGNLVDLGSPTHLGSDFVDDLFRLLPPAGAIGRPSPPRPAERGVCGRGSAGRAAGGRGGALVPRHPPRRRRHGAGDANCALVQHGGLHGPVPSPVGLPPKTIAVAEAARIAGGADRSI